MTQKPSQITIAQVEEVFLRIPSVIARTGISKAEIYRRMKLGRFPRGQRISHKVTVWKRSDVEDWMRSKFASVDDLL